MTPLTLNPGLADVEPAESVHDEMHQVILRNSVPQTREHQQRSVLVNGDEFGRPAYSTPQAALS